MKPEQRAAKLAKGVRGILGTDEFEHKIARALRAERNRALEEAAKAVEGWKGIRVLTVETLADAANHVRSLKSPAPSKRKGAR